MTPGVARGLQAIGLSILIVVSCGRTAVAAVLPPSLSAKLDPRLLADLLPGGPARTVWLDLTDKGERGPADLALALGRAAASLTERNRARRARARVAPLVDYRDLPVHPAYLDTLERRGLAIVAVSRWLNRVAVRATGERLPELAELPFVERIAPVAEVSRIRDVPASPEAADPWRFGRSGAIPRPEAAAIDYGRTYSEMAQIDVASLHSCGFTGSGVRLCVIDNGFGLIGRHEALPFPPAPGMTRDFVDGDTVVTQSSFEEHGSRVLGLLAAHVPGAYVGAAFDADFALARTEDDTLESPREMLYWGMAAEWADSIGADLISSSLGYFTFEDTAQSYTYADLDGHTTVITREAEIAASKGILVVNAAGNEGNTPWTYVVAPADVDGDSLIAVGAVDQGGNVASFSSRGPTADGRIKPDLVASGVNVPLIDGGGSSRYTTRSGTSFATPLVAGLAACLMQARPSWTPRDIIRALRETASRASRPDQLMGYGIPNGMAALQWPGGPTSAPPGFFGLALSGPQPLRLGGPDVSIRFGLGLGAQESVEAHLRVVDVQGRRVRSLWSGLLCAGQTVTASWNGRGDEGGRVASGVYWITLEGHQNVTSARCVVLG